MPPSKFVFLYHGSNRVKPEAIYKEVDVAPEDPNNKPNAIIIYISSLPFLLFDDRVWSHSGAFAGEPHRYIAFHTESMSGVGRYTFWGLTYPSIASKILEFLDGALQ